MMKNNFLIGMILIASMCYSQDNFPVLKGSYFGQTPPGNTPEVFVPGIISTLDKYELNSVFSPDGNEFYYEISTTTPEEKKQGKYFYVIMVSKNINGQWIKPEMAEFSGKFSTYDLCFAPDGERIYFTSDRDDPWNDTKENHIWFVNKTKNGWSDAKILGPPVFSNEGESQMTITKDGSMIFRKGDDLFFSQNENGIFKEPVKLGEEINSPYSESEPCISPDESFLLYFRYAMPVSIDKGRGLYISFKEDDGSWSPSQNTGILGSLPKFSHDGKYFFFSRSGDVYWVNASVIHKLSIQNIINHYYIKGLKTRDFKLIRAVCIPETKLNGVRKDGELNTTTLDQWSKKFDPENPPFQKLDYEIIKIDIEGTAAQVKIKFIVNNQSIIYDYLNLLKIKGRWKIVNIIDY